MRKVLISLSSGDGYMCPLFNIGGDYFTIVTMWDNKCDEICNSWRVYLIMYGEIATTTWNAKLLSRLLGIVC